MSLMVLLENRLSLETTVVDLSSLAYSLLSLVSWMESCIRSPVGEGSELPLHHVVLKFLGLFDLLRTVLNGSTLLDVWQAGRRVKRVLGQCRVELMPVIELMLLLQCIRCCLNILSVVVQLAVPSALSARYSGRTLVSVVSQADHSRVVETKPAVAVVGWRQFPHYLI